MHADSPPRVHHLCLKDYGRDTFAVGDIDLPSGTTAPLCGSADLATLGLGEPPPLPRPTRLYKLASGRARSLTSYASWYAESYVLRLVVLTLSLLAYASSVRGR